MNAATPPSPPPTTACSTPGEAAYPRPAAARRHPRFAARADPDPRLPRRAHPVLPGAAQYGRVRGACHPHHRRCGAGPPPGRDRRQGAVRQGNPRGPGRRPHRFRGAQPEGPGDRDAARHRARLHAEARGRARRADPRRRTASRADPGRPVRLPAWRRGRSAPRRSAARRSCCTPGRTSRSPRCAATCRPGWTSWPPVPAPPRCSPMPG